MRAILVSTCFIYALAAGPAFAEDSAWPQIQDQLFAGRSLEDGASQIALDAPTRAQDAATVPITVRALQPQTAERYIKTIQLIIDENPAPVAAVFHFFPASGEATIGTRVRVNDYTSLHAVAETSDGHLYVVDRFIKAAGGCSAPGMKDKDAVMARLGKMQLKPMTSFAPGRVQQAELLISHPNYTGMQMDQLTRLWIPPDYVRHVLVRVGDTPVLEVDGDISIAENPAFTFSFEVPAAAPISVQAEDSKGRKFEQTWPIEPTT